MNPLPLSTPQRTDAAKHIGWRRRLSRRMALSDAIVLALTMATSIALKFGFEIQPVAQGPFGMNYPTFAAFIAAAWLIVLQVFDTRDPHIIGDGVLEYRRLVRATSLMFGALAIASVLFKWDMSRGFLAISFPLGLVGLIASRHGWRRWLAAQRRKGLNVSRVLVVGGPEAAQRLAATFSGRADTGMRVVGLWAVDSAPESTLRLTATTTDIPVFDRGHDILDAIRNASADTVIVTRSDHLGPDGMRELTWSLEGLNVELLVSPNLVDVSAPRMQLGRVANEPFIHLQKPQYAEAGNVLKALMDRAGGALILMAASPLLALAFLAIKTTSPGPAFFLQDRIGKDGRPFRIYKLRTMRTNADQELASLLEEQGAGDSPFFKVTNDPRITRIGHWLRRYSVDELPQLINVLRGEMSLVGPRPQRAEEVSLYDHRARRRLTVRPGMTGLWQVSGRSDLPWEEAVRLDLYYVENWSMTGDLLILWKTIQTVISAHGAR